MNDFSDKLFEVQYLDEVANNLATHIAKGRAWDKKYNDQSNIYKLIKSLASIYRAVQEKIKEVADEFNLNKSILLLDEWEKSVGLPDPCVGQLNNLISRRNAVLDKLGKVPYVELADFQALVDELFPDAGIILEQGKSYYSFEYKLPVKFGGQNNNFVIIAKVPTDGKKFQYKLPVKFEGVVNATILTCILNKILPSNVILNIKYVKPFFPVQTILIGGDGSTLIGGDGSTLLGG